MSALFIGGSRRNALVEDRLRHGRSDDARRDGNHAHTPLRPFYTQSLG